MQKALLSTIMLLGLIGYGINTSPVVAQDSPLAEDQKAVMVFDFRMEKMQSGDLGKALDIEGQMANLPTQSADSPAPDSIARIFGAVSAPESMDAIQNMQMADDLAMEFFTRIEFKEADDAKMHFDTLVEKSDEKTIGGKTYYSPKEDEEGPKNMLVNMVDEKTIEFGTEAYLTRSNRKVFTDGLNDAWSKVPDDAIRFAIDMNGAEGLVEDLMDMGRESVPPNFAAYVDLLGNAKDLRITFDLDGKNLMTLGATGVDEDSAVELQEGLDSLLGFAKMGAMQGVGQLKQQDPDAAEVASELVESLAATVEGDQVSIQIAKPEGFNEAVQRMVPGGNN